MSRKSKAILGAVLAAIALVAVSASAAYAADPIVHLQIFHTAARYGDDFYIQPSIEGTQVVPGDTVTLEAQALDGTWSTFGEGLKVEDTGTVDPQSVNVDDTFLPWFNSAWQPVKFRATYKSSRFKTVATPSASSTVIPFASVEQPTEQIVRMGRPNLSRTVPTKVTHKKRFTIAAQTAPWSGGAALLVRIIKPNGKTYNTLAVTTDETGYGALSTKIGSKGKYRVQITWLGNAFAAPSKTFTSTITVK